MTDDYGCKVCGKHFEEEVDLKSHGKDDHPEVNEVYGKEIFGTTDPNDAQNEQDNLEYNDEKPYSEFPDKKDDADEIDQQEDKPTQSHDDWKNDLDSMRDQYSTEEVLKRATEDEESDQRDITNDINKPYDLVPKIPEPWEYGGADYKREGDPDGDKAEEEGGADDPLKKVADLSESYRFMSRDKRASLFESLKFTQGDSAILAGLEWNELTRPIKVEASEEYSKVGSYPSKDEFGNPLTADIPDEEEEEENKAYESLYNVERHHSSPDFKKKSLICSKCNESFYNFNDRSVHFNEVHATEQEYELPDQCPFCKEIIQEPDTLDWHMQEQHGAHVASQFTQTGVSAGMADTDLDSLESYKKATEGQGGTYGRSSYMLNPQHEDITTCVVCGRDIDSHSNPSTDYRGMRGDAPPTDHYFLGGDQGGSDDKYDFESHKATEAKWECLDCDQKFDDAGKHQDETGHHNIARSHGESRATPGFDTNCTDGEPHEPAYKSSTGTDMGDTTCVKCGKTIGQTSEGSGYWFTPEDYVEWDRAVNNLDEYGNIVRESYKAKEVTGDYWWGNHVKWESGMDQDFLYCNHCGRDLYVDASYHGDGSASDENVNAVVQTHMRDHGITESYAKEAKISSGDLYQYGSKVGTIRDYNSKQHEGYVTLDGIGIEEFGAMTSDFEVRVNGERIPNKWDGKHDYNLDLFGESRASDLRKEIKKKEKFINMASFENPLNMGDDEAKLADMKSELASLGETFGDYEVDCDCDKDPSCPKCKGKGTTTWTSSIYQGDEGAGGHQDLDDTTEYPDDPEEEQEKAEEEDDKSKHKPRALRVSDILTKVPKEAEEDEPVEKWDKDDDIGRNYAEPTGDDEPLDDDSYWQGRMEEAEEDNYVDDSDNAGEKYICEDCDKDFSSDTALQEHQFSYYHGDYKEDSDGEQLSPRNVMGGW